MKARLLAALLFLATLALSGCAWLKDEFFFTLSRTPPASAPASPLEGP